MKRFQVHQRLMFQGFFFKNCPLFLIPDPQIRTFACIFDLTENLVKHPHRHAITKRAAIVCFKFVLASWHYNFAPYIFANQGQVFFGLI